MYLGAVATRTTLAALPEGAAGVRATLDVMRAFANAGKKNPFVRETALSLISALPPKNYLAEISALHKFVRDNVRYARDIHGVETVQDPAYTLDKLAGDCDDKSTLLAAMLASIGHETAFKAVGFKMPGSYSHVYVLAKPVNSKEWIPLETTVSGAPAGWEPPGVITSTVVKV